MGVDSPQLQNIVATVDLDCGKLDLKKIAMHARNAEYNPKRFAAVIMRIREPRTTALIFSSGKMVCTGNKFIDMLWDPRTKTRRTEKKSKLGQGRGLLIILPVLYRVPYTLF